MKFLGDLFKGVGGQAWELARFSAAFAILSYTFAFLWALIRLGKVPDWSSLGVGYAAVLGAAGLFIGIKDYARAQAASVTSAAATDAGVKQPPGTP